MRPIDADKLREKLVIDYNANANYFGEIVLKEIAEAPTVEPERPEGKWLIIWHKSLSGTWNNYYEYRCSECGHFSRESEYLYQWRPRFCPKCGAKMVDEVRLADKVGG